MVTWLISRRRWLGPIGLVSALIIVAPAFAGWNPAGTPICALPGNMYRPVVAPDGAGGAYIAWADARQGDNAGVRMQHVNALGNALWTTNGIRVCTNTGFEDFPAVIPDGAGGVIVAWRDSRIPTENDIYAQRLNAAGAMLWPAAGALVHQGPGFVDPPRVCIDGSGGVIVAWTQFPSAACVDPCRDVYAQRLSATGVRLWSPAQGVPICTATGGQSDVAIVTDDSGGAVMAWCDRRGADADIYAQRVNALGQSQWTGTGLAVCTAAGDQLLPAETALESGTAVTWDDYRDGGEPYPYGQAFELNGTPYVAVDGICLAPGQPGQGARGLALENGALFAFQGSPDVQKVDSDGVVLWGPTGITLCPGGQTDLPPWIVTDGSDGAIVVWLNTTLPGPAHVDAQRIDGSGNVLWAEYGVALGPTAYPQAFFSAASDGIGGAIAAWEDARNGGKNVYAQRITGAGIVGPTTDVTAGTPAAPRIHPPRPNPMHHRTSLEFSLPAGGRVDIAILDVTGRLVRRLAQGAGFGPGTHAVEWDGTDDSGRAMPGGIYLARVVAGGRSSEFRIALIH